MPALQLTPRQWVTAAMLTVAALATIVGALELNKVAAANDYWQPVPVPLEASKFTGPWCVAGGTAMIELDASGRLTVKNEHGMATPGRFRDGTTIIATGWDNLEARLGEGDKALTWKDGSVWRRQDSCAPS